MAARRVRRGSFRPMRRALSVVLAAALLAGCGAPKHARGSAPGSQAFPKATPREPDVNPSQLPPADRTAYFQLALASAQLRIAAAPYAIGTRGPSPHAIAGLLGAARQHARALRPRDATLTRARIGLLAAVEQLGRAARGHKPTRAAARAALNASSAVNAQLSTYTRAHPSVGQVVPD
jgi:hypothetical protein